VNKNGIQSFDVLLLLFVAVICGILYWSTPFSGDNSTHNWQITPWIGQGLRYAFPFFGILAILAACGADAIKIPGVVQLILVGITAGLIFDQTNTLFGATIGILVFGYLSLVDLQKLRSLFSSTPKIVLSASLILVIITVFSISVSRPALQQRTEQKASYFGEIIPFIEENISSDETIGYILTEWPTLLYGMNLDQDTIWIPAATNATREEWIQVLQDQGVDFVAFGRWRDPVWNVARELSWLDSPDGTFKRVFGDDILQDVVLWRLKE
jgi:hypothetical protein